MAGRRAAAAITTANVADALALFEEVAEAQLARLPEADRALERTHLLGSAAAPGLGRARLHVRDRAGGRRDRAAARARARRHVRVRDGGRSRDACGCAPRPIASTCSPTARCASSTTSSGGRRRRRARCSCRSTASAREQALDGAARPLVDVSARRLRRVQGEERVRVARRHRHRCRRRWPTGRSGSSRRSTASSAASSRSDPDEPFLCTLVRLRRRLPQGLRRR